MLERSIKQLNVTPVAFPHPGGITLTISQAQLEPNVPKIKGQTGLAVFVYSAIEGSACGTGLSVGYAVVQTLNGWTAEPYTYAMC